jgi:hypothetical protein
VYKHGPEVYLSYLQTWLFDITDMHRSIPRVEEVIEFQIKLNMNVREISKSGI